jgi:Outer membrane protein beta-barrel domain
MKRLILVMAVIAISTIKVHAQESAIKKILLSLGVEAGIPVGTPGVSVLYSFAIGGSLQGAYFISPDFGLTLKAGYLDYLPKAGQKDGGLIPILAGFRYYLNPKVYASGQLGVAFSTNSDGPGPLSGGSSFTYAPGIGFQVSKQVDIFARYEAASKSLITIGDIGVRLAYNFN